MPEFETVERWIYSIEQPFDYFATICFLFTTTGLLFLAWGFLAIRRRRPLLLLGAIALSFAGIIYLFFDWRHAYLNLAMCDAQKVRAECTQLLESKNASGEEASKYTFLRAPEIPPALSRLGAKFLIVTPTNVQISLTHENGVSGGAWGYLYQTDQIAEGQDRPRETRPTWYRNFYEFRVRGE